MPNDIEVQTNSVEVQQGTAAEITTTVIEAEIVEQQIAEVTPHRFVLSSDGLYSSGGSDVGNTPQWLADAIQAEVTSGNATLTSVVSDLSIYTQNLSDHVNQEVFRLDAEDLRQDGLITTVKSELDGDIAAISVSLLTKVTDTEASALATDVVATEFGGLGGVVANSFFIGNIASYSSDIDSHTTSIDAMYSSITDPATGLTAIASNIQVGYTTVGLNPDGSLNAGAGEFGLLTAAIGDVDVRLQTEEGVSVGTHIWDGIEILTIGMKRYLNPAVLPDPFIDGNIEVYMGGIAGWVASLVGDTGLGYTSNWAGGASSFITAPNGSITGWNYAASGAGDSEFVISADTFKVVSPTQSVDALPTFTVDTASGRSTFNGLVEFTGLGINSDSTTIDGDVITTGKIQSVDTQTYFDLDNNHIRMHNSTAGFTLDSTAAGTNADPSINGAYIKGGTIEGASIVLDDIRVRAISYPDNFGSVQFHGFAILPLATRATGSTTYSSSIRVPGPGYGTGFDKSRACSVTGSSSGVVEVHGVTNTLVYCTVIHQTSTDDVNWTTVATSTSEDIITVLPLPTSTGVLYYRFGVSLPGYTNPGLGGYIKVILHNGQ